MPPYQRIAALALVGLLLAACVPLAATPAPELSPLTTSAPGEAGPADATSDVISPLATPVRTRQEATSSPGFGSVSGWLHRFDGTPLVGITVYASPLEEHGSIRLAAIDPLLSPHTPTDAQGGFAIGNLAPGEYALATQSPVGIIMPHNEAGEIVIFTVAADSATDLEMLPIGYPYPD